VPEPRAGRDARSGRRVVPGRVIHRQLCWPERGRRQVFRSCPAGTKVPI